ncbi:hypothetical protein B0T25DRAFT_555586 [Lasiosphaeria hispida]|uniref:AAA+ ATPase domain-containing protein n=1 Tax=Lasiosphaeria hispida TaxID=260671 RepID=A0AAJ0M9K3_9PEZI|nr:hypothetical protein B0T25DRAFT_555586 [Lasiosphaeria hispida]
MKAAGARALLSAKCSCRLPRVAAHNTIASSILPDAAFRHVALGNVSFAAGVRSFRTSSPALSSADDPNADEKPSAPSNDKSPAAAGTETTGDNAAPAPEKNNSTPAEAARPPPPSSTANIPPPATAYKETLRSQGYGSARARASRVRAEEAPPPPSLPAWFVNEHVSLYESRPIGGPQTLLLPLAEADRENVLAVLTSQFDKTAVTQADVDAWRERLNGVMRAEDTAVRERVMDEAEEAFDALVGRLRAFHMAAYMQTLALVHTEMAEPEHVERLRRHHQENEDDIMRLLWWFDEQPLSSEAQRWLANIRSDSLLPGSGYLHQSPLATRPEPEYPACMELLAVLRAELLAEPPKSKQRDVQRPVTVLSVLNRKGSSLAVSVMNDIATDLKADVVHLDAASLARLLGKHLGQNLHWSRGSVSVLGYASAEMNGRLVSRTDDNEIRMVVNLPPRLRSWLSPKDSGSTSVNMDGRWEELKMVQALEALVVAADAKHETKHGKATRSDRDLIVHLHDYVEISSLHEGIINKLRVIVDRLWQKGRKIVLVGSSSSSEVQRSQWYEQLVELGQEGSHIIPLHASGASDWMEKHDNFRENIDNIKNMLQAMLGSSADVTFDMQIQIDNGAVLVEEKYAELVQTLSQNLYDVQWVYRLASLMMGSRTPRFQKFKLAHLQYAFDIVSDRNKHWTSLNPSVRPPYFSPLFTQRGRDMPPFTSSDPEDWPQQGMPGGPQQSAGAGGDKEFDQHEKKLLAGLINAEDIHTTFNDIIVPAETKESLIGLTSLSLTRPDAFSYGVLKTERIPGCLLYGPPGTGKTLLAKAVAKESGANMLEVSAASINDMWLGQSEKNVRALFSLARKMAPMVIFLDEADALLGARHNSPGRSSHRETITQFLREWDGLSDMRAFIMVATNRPFDLDEAVLRRLPRKILVDLPLKMEREGILRVMLRDEAVAPDVDLAQLAVETELYSGSDLKNLCVSAAMEAVREEVRAKDAHAAAAAAAAAEKASEEGEVEPPEAYVFPEKRTLTRAHFDKGLKEISASISEDMESLKAIRKFDSQYGDSGRKKRTKRSMGFEVVPEGKGSGEARVRQVVVEG